MFSLLVRRDGLIEPPRMSAVDTHCHILPGLDDGAPDEEMSCAIAHLLLALGVREVVATPHVMSDAYPNTSAGIKDAVGRLEELFERREIPLGIVPGAEYYVERQLLDQIERDDVLAWGEERYVLFETPMHQEDRKSVV
jgi:protein-tyrosine phosphatase